MNNRGISLVEMVVFGAISTAMLLTFSQYLRVYVKGTHIFDFNVQAFDTERVATRFIQDMREADPLSIDWTQIPPVGLVYNQVQFNKLIYDPLAPNTPIVVPVRYGIDTTQRTLYKVEGGSTTVLMKDVAPPTSMFPLVHKDTSGSLHNMLILNLLYQPQRFPEKRLSRRVWVRG